MTEKELLPETLSCGCIVDHEKKKVDVCYGHYAMIMEGAMMQYIDDILAEDYPQRKSLRWTIPDTNS
jgi:hypothetical protein